MKALKIIGVALAGAILFLALVVLSKQTHTAIGSVTQGNEYHATTTSTGRFGSTVTLTSTTSPVQGTLGSIVITGAAAGTIEIYDATTSDVTKRTSNASSSILMASIPASAAAGTYTFDTTYYNGLIVNITGTMPTTTITYR